MDETQLLNYIHPVVGQEIGIRIHIPNVGLISHEIFKLDQVKVIDHEDGRQYSLVDGEEREYLRFFLKPQLICEYYDDFRCLSLKYPRETEICIYH